MTVGAMTQLRNVVHEGLSALIALFTMVKASRGHWQAHRIVNVRSPAGVVS